MVSAPAPPTTVLAPTPVVMDQAEWGLDHGTWSVLVHAFPDADIPVVQLSLDTGLTPSQRVEIGRRLSPLRDEGVLIIASGNIVHNLRTMDWNNAGCEPFDWATRFNNEMRDAILKNEPERVRAFEAMGDAARLAAPTPEHLGSTGDQNRTMRF